MEKCVIIINRRSGGSKKVSFDKVEACLGVGRYAYQRFTLPDDGDFNIDEYSAVAVCGGDGTLGWVLDKAYDRPVEVYYFPVGTLNDKAKAMRYSHLKTSCPSFQASATKGKPIVVGLYQKQTKSHTVSHSFDDDMCEKLNTGIKNKDKQVFGYVLAAGTFTPIGYTAKVALKQRIGVLAYIGEVLKEYKIHRINARINADGKEWEGQFTLLMFLKSPRCFGFRFNKAFDAESESGHLIAIRSPGRGGIAGAVTLFCRFFRVFFVGLKKPMDKNIIFKRAVNVHVEQFDDADYCRDGELQRVGAGEYGVSFVKSKCRFCVIEKF